MSNSAEDHEIRMRELDIREKEISNDRYLGLTKIITTGVVVTLIPAILTYMIQKQEVEIQTLKGEIEYLKQFSEKVVERDDLTKRKNFVQYLATVAHSKDSRDRWNDYLLIVNEAAEQQEALEEELSKTAKNADREERRVTALAETVESIKVKDPKNPELDKLKEQLRLAKETLQDLDEKILEKTAEKDALIKKSRLSVDHEPSVNQVPVLVTNMNSKERPVRLRAVKELIDKHRSDPLAITLAIDNLKPPLLDALSASGRINVLVFLRNTDKSSWTDNFISRGRIGVALIRKRDAENVAPLGPQTKEALIKFEEFLNAIDNET